MCILLQEWIEIFTKNVKLDRFIRNTTLQMDSRDIPEYRFQIIQKNRKPHKTDKHYNKKLKPDNTLKRIAPL
jgi:hypothetical protein